MRFKILVAKLLNIGTLLFVALVLRLTLYARGTLYLDFNTYLGWSNRLVDLPFDQFYLAWSDYLPGYLYILWFLGKLAHLFIPQLLLYKSPAILADLLTAYLIYKIVLKKRKQKIALITAAIFLFNPAVIANSTLWGQVDSLISLFSILALYFFESNMYFSAIALSLGVLIKPQTALVLPVIIYYFYETKRSLTKFVTYGAISLTVFVAGFAAFSNKNLVLFIYERILATLGQYPYKSINAFNFWGIFGQWQSDNLSTTVTSIVALTLVFVSLIKSVHKKTSAYVLLSGLYLAGFLFMGRMHERHMLAVFAPLAIALSEVPYLIIVYLVLSITYLMNLRYSFVWLNESFKEIFSDFSTKAISVLNTSTLFMFIYFVKNKVGEKLPKFLFTNSIKFQKEVDFGKDISISLAKKLMLLILLFSAVSRLWMLGVPRNEYFDEVYHAFTAKIVLHNDSKAWEWWNPHPPGFAYEWTPPTSTIC